MLVPLDSWSSTYGTLKESGGPSAYVHTLEPQHQGYHEEPHKPMDRGDCQGSLHSSWLSVRPCDGSWGPSAFSFMGVQLSGGPTWHPGSGVLEVFWGVPEFGSARHGLCCWGHVDTGSSGGCTTRSGSRASSPTSIAYTICMQPLLRRSFWGVPEFGSARHGLRCWGHVDTGSSGGCTTRSGSRASSPTSIAYTICMQPLLRRS